MDYALQVHEAKYIFPIPDGLKELSSDIIREVLRHQPEHINGFIADYLETMLVVREHTRDTAEVICDVFEQGRFLEELFKTKNVNCQQANAYATTIQANWRGYVVRRKLAEWLKKKKKVDEEKERKRTLKIEELLDAMGITYEEATRAAGLIQTAYKESKRSKSAYGDSGETWAGERMPFGQRVREGDKAAGRFDKWEKEDFGDFFETDQDGVINYIWPRVGQLRKVLRDDIPEDAAIVEFFGMRDLQGQEHYSYLIKSQTNLQRRGVPIGFLIPVPQALILEGMPEVAFVSDENTKKMGNYTYVYRDVVDRVEVQKIDELLKAEMNAVDKKDEISGEFDYDPHWVLPRVLIRIKQDHLLAHDLEVTFKTLPGKIVCEEEKYTFRAETLEQTAKVIRFILRDECLSMEDAMVKAANLSPYKLRETGRIFPVDVSSVPDFVQRIEIMPESTTGEDTRDLSLYEFVFLPLRAIRRLSKGEPLVKIYMTRFQGYHSDYTGSASLENKVFVMGPKLRAVNGRALTYESFFWNEFGEEAWQKLLFDIACHKFEYDVEIEGPAEEDEGFTEVFGETEYKSKGFDEVREISGEETTTAPTTTAPYHEGVSEGKSIITVPAKSVEGEGAKGEAKGETKGEAKSEVKHEAAGEDKPEEDENLKEPVKSLESLDE
ncbi:hypothetical protein RUM43_000210 [Polyplax serrata]|uniref:RIIa domain-containing protein n=1 Tax=Polyplax serrata TaxID=468196 RepID=A0AAN8XNN4_POLSC